MKIRNLFRKDHSVDKPLPKFYVIEKTGYANDVQYRYRSIVNNSVGAWCSSDFGEDWKNAKAKAVASGENHESILRHYLDKGIPLP